MHAVSPLRGSGSPQHREQMGGHEDLHPTCDALKWLKEHQRSYTDDQLDFWSLLWLLTDVLHPGEEVNMGARMPACIW